MAAQYNDVSLFRKFESFFQDVLILEPKNQYAHNNLAVLYYYFRHLELARTHFLRAKEIDPENQKIRENYEIAHGIRAGELKTSSYL
jgi:Tfp pilus assembly protein PilF